MNLRWRLWEDDFDTVCLPEFEEEECGAVPTSGCFGRGKTLAEMIIPRVPIVAINGDAGEISDNTDSCGSDKQPIVGRGRARLLKHNAEVARQKEAKRKAHANELRRLKVSTASSGASEVIPNSAPQAVLSDSSYFASWKDSDFPSLTSQNVSKKRSPKVHSGKSFPKTLHKTARLLAEDRHNVYSDTDSQNEHMYDKNVTEGMSSATGFHEQRMLGNVVLDSRLPNVEVEESTLSYPMDSHSIWEASSELSSDIESIPYTVTTNVCEELTNLSSASSIANMNAVDDNPVNPDVKSGTLGVLRKKNKDCPSRSPWRLQGQHMIQVDGLPEYADLSVLHEMMFNFGTLLDWECSSKEGKKSVRYSLETADQCDWAISCLNGTECLYPDNRCELVCFKIT